MKTILNLKNNGINAAKFLKYNEFFVQQPKIALTPNGMTIEQTGNNSKENLR